MYEIRSNSEEKQNVRLWKILDKISGCKTSMTNRTRFGASMPTYILNWNIAINKTVKDLCLCTSIYRVPPHVNLYSHKIAVWSNSAIKLTRRKKSLINRINYAGTLQANFQFNVVDGSFNLMNDSLTLFLCNSFTGT